MKKKKKKKIRHGGADDFFPLTTHTRKIKATWVFVCQHQSGPGEIITANAQGWGAENGEGAGDCGWLNGSTAGKAKPFVH